MKNRIQPLYDITLELSQKLKGEIPADQREEIISEINSVLEHRDKMIEGIKPPYSEEEMETGRTLLPINREVQDKLKQLLIRLRTEMKTVKKQKSSNNKYTNPYKQLANYDGMFLDQKK
ncbi:flagellar protein FliT [Sediminibacillus halophilus]|uniref:Flagellar protein FliT n=1 Tax=Sediminibacillus halophilus TaxID=482461 RepID=A0A1G9RDH1_9BACI|nr:flagellar protein FliT [Sediminibacillus halophilus]SDM20495.1 flagellar protein FliT [Sediminibacillus halophilus]